MTVYFVTGKLGSGKSLVATGKIRDYMIAGRRVATNLDLYIDAVFTQSKATAVRLPDKPRAEDMEALGSGYEHDDPRHNDESRYGLIVLDECGTWLNSREWNDKGRRKLIDWCLHARKKRWDIIFLIQDIEAVDGQIYRALGEHLVICRRMDKYKLPLLRISMPRFHVANVYYGRADKSNHVDRWVYRGTDLYTFYDTMQQFNDGHEYYGDQLVDMRAMSSMLSGWHLKGRYLGVPAVRIPLHIRAIYALWKLVLLPALLWMDLTEHEWSRRQARAWNRRCEGSGPQKTLLLSDTCHQNGLVAIEPSKPSPPDFA